MEETHMEEKHETKNEKLVSKAQNLTCYLPKSRGLHSKNVGAMHVCKHHTLDNALSCTLYLYTI